MQRQRCLVNKVIGVVAALSFSTVCVAGCGARSGLRSPNVDVITPRDIQAPPDSLDVVSIDVQEIDVPEVFDVQNIDVPDGFDSVDVPNIDVPNRDVPNIPDVPDACAPAQDRCVGAEICNNGLDDNCNGQVDEGCPCAPGMVQQCFAGPPGRRNVGICQDGTQICIGQGMWGECQGGIVPQPDQCNSADNLCNGCSQQRNCEIQCPSPNDPRVPDGRPFNNYLLRGGLFYRGAAQSWSWRIEGGPCDRIGVALQSFDLMNPTNETATFFPRLSGDYTVRLTVVTETGETRTCVWIVHVEGPGIRVEMCYPESETRDLDLFVHQPGSVAPWYGSRPVDVFRPTAESCGWHNCEATIRGTGGLGGAMVPRANWGYGRSPLAECQNGPQGPQWRSLGFCANPRLDIDNNLAEGTGVPENINIDQPRDGDVFRVMVQNFSGSLARPLVNIYCSGRRQATFGAAPDEVRGFEHERANNSDVGAMWRVADVRAIVAGGRTSCEVTALRSPGIFRGYWVTISDPSY